MRECECSLMCLCLESDTNRGHGGFFIMVGRSRSYWGRKRMGGQNRRVKLHDTGLCVQAEKTKGIAQKTLMP